MFRARRKHRDTTPAATPAATMAATEAPGAVDLAQTQRTLTKIGAASEVDQLKNQLTITQLQGQIAVVDAQNKIAVGKVERTGKRVIRTDKVKDRTAKAARRRAAVAEVFSRAWKALCAFVKNSADKVAVVIPVTASGVAAWYGQWLFFHLVIGWHWLLAAGAAFAIESAYFAAFSRARQAREADPFESAAAERAVGWFVVFMAAALNGAHAIVQVSMTPEQAAEMARRASEQPETLQKLASMASGSVTASVAVGFLSLLGPSLWELHERRKWRNEQIRLERAGHPHGLLPRLPAVYHRRYRAEARAIRDEAVRRLVAARYPELLAFAEDQTQATRQEQQRRSIERGLRGLAFKVQAMLHRRRMSGPSAAWPEPIVRATIDPELLSQARGQSAVPTPGQSPTVTVGGQSTVRAGMPTTSDNLGTDNPRDDGQSAVPAPTTPGTTDSPLSTSPGQSAVPALSADTANLTDTTVILPVVITRDSAESTSANPGQWTVPGFGRHAASTPESGQSRRVAIGGTYHGQRIDLRRDTVDSGESRTVDSADRGQSAVQTGPAAPLRGGPLTVGMDSGLSRADGGQSRPGDDGLSTVPGPARADSPLSTKRPGPDNGLSVSGTDGDGADSGQSRLSETEDSGLSADMPDTGSDGQWTVPGVSDNRNRPVTQLATPAEVVVQTGIAVILGMWDATGVFPKQDEVIGILRSDEHRLRIANRLRSTYWQQMKTQAIEQRRISA